jgi:hypothetical protein
MNTTEKLDAIADKCRELLANAIIAAWEGLL